MLYLFEFIVFNEVDEFDTFEHALRNGSVLLWVVLTCDKSSPQEVKRYCAVFASVGTQSDLLGTIFLGRDTHDKGVKTSNHIIASERVEGGIGVSSVL